MDRESLDIKLNKLDFEAIDELKIHLKNHKVRACEFSVGNNLLWSQYYETQYGIVNDMLIYCKVKDGVIVSTTFPICEKSEDEMKKTFDAIVNHFEKQGVVLNLFSVVEDGFKLIEKWYPGEFEINYNRDYFDYIYEVDKLANLSGSKMHGKRNHINRFIEEFPDYSYEKITSDNYKDCIKVAKDWVKENDKVTEEEKEYEIYALTRGLENMNFLGFKGGLIRCNGNVVAFSIGEQLTEDTFVVHFEKAYSQIQGAYAIINREFVRNEMMEYKYVNREEDLGIEGLRKAKLSYRPDILLKKGNVTIKS